MEEKKTKWTSPRNTRKTVLQNEATIRAYVKEVQKLNQQLTELRLVLARGGK